MSISPFRRTGNGPLQYLAGDIPEFIWNYIKRQASRQYTVGTPQFLHTQSRYIHIFDLSAMEQLRLSRHQVTSPASNAKLAIRGSMSYSLTPANYVPLGYDKITGQIVDVAVRCDAGIEWRNSGWIDIREDFKKDNVIIALMAIDGDGTTVTMRDVHLSGR